MKTALIGYSGFVGSNLLPQHDFDDLYNSSNIQKIKGKAYDMIISAGAKADRSYANNHSTEDWEGIEKLLDSLHHVSTQTFVLISTIDVYPDRVGVDEDTYIDEKLLVQPYGRHRYKLEQEIKRMFHNTIIIRCPNLYGTNLKKNFVYDLINDTNLNLRHKDSLLQYYNLKNMWQDIQKTIENNINLINFATEPAISSEIAAYTLGLDFNNVTFDPPMYFDFRSKYSMYWGSNDGYLYHKGEILEELRELVIAERKKLQA